MLINNALLKNSIDRLELTDTCQRLETRRKRFL
jgi:hypothetical protein